MTEVKLTRPIHGEAGPFRIDVSADGSVKMTSNQIDASLTAEEFATFSALVARVRETQGDVPRIPPKPRRKRRTRAEIEASRAAAVNGVADAQTSAQL